jgi:hypothetical protein
MLQLEDNTRVSVAASENESVSLPHTADSNVLLVDDDVGNIVGAVQHNNVVVDLCKTQSKRNRSTRGVERAALSIVRTGSADIDIGGMYTSRSAGQ